MNIPATHPRIEASSIPTDELAGNASLTEEQKIGEATRQFEAMLLRQILESTQKTVIQSKYADNSTAAGIYRDMVTNQLADSISKTGSLGLAQTLKTEFTRQVKAEAPEANEPDATASPLFYQSAKHLNHFSPPKPEKETQS